MILGSKYNEDDLFAKNMENQILLESNRTRQKSKDKINSWLEISNQLQGVKAYGGQDLFYMVGEESEAFQLKMQRAAKYRIESTGEANEVKNKVGGAGVTAGGQKIAKNDDFGGSPKRPKTAGARPQKVVKGPRKRVGVVGGLFKPKKTVNRQDEKATQSQAKRGIKKLKRSLRRRPRSRKNTKSSLRGQSELQRLKNSKSQIYQKPKNHAKNNQSEVKITKRRGTEFSEMLKSPVNNEESLYYDHIEKTRSHRKSPKISQRDIAGKVYMHKRINSAGVRLKNDPNSQKNLNFHEEYLRTRKSEKNNSSIYSMFNSPYSHNNKAYYQYASSKSRFLHQKVKSLNIFPGDLLAAEMMLMRHAKVKETPTPTQTFTESTRVKNLTKFTGLVKRVRDEKSNFREGLEVKVMTAVVDSEPRGSESGRTKAKIRVGGRNLTRYSRRSINENKQKKSLGEVLGAKAGSLGTVGVRGESSNRRFLTFYDQEMKNEKTEILEKMDENGFKVVSGRIVDSRSVDLDGLGDSESLFLVSPKKKKFVKRTISGRSRATEENRIGKEGQSGAKKSRPMTAGVKNSRKKVKNQRPLSGKLATSSASFAPSNHAHRPYVKFKTSRGQPSPKNAQKTHKKPKIRKSLNSYITPSKSKKRLQEALKRNQEHREDFMNQMAGLAMKKKLEIEKKPKIQKNRKSWQYTKIQLYEVKEDSPASSPNPQNRSKISKLSRSDTGFRNSKNQKIKKKRSILLSNTGNLERRHEFERRSAKLRAQKRIKPQGSSRNQQSSIYLNSQSKLPLKRKKRRRVPKGIANVQIGNSEYLETPKKAKKGQSENFDENDNLRYDLKDLASESSRLLSLRQEELGFSPKGRRKRRKLMVEKDNFLVAKNGKNEPLSLFKQTKLLKSPFYKLGGPHSDKYGLKINMEEKSPEAVKEVIMEDFMASNQFKVAAGAPKGLDFGSKGLKRSDLVLHNFVRFGNSFEPERHKKGLLKGPVLMVGSTRSPETEKKAVLVRDPKESFFQEINKTESVNAKKAIKRQQRRARLKKQNGSDFLAVDKRAFR